MLINLDRLAISDYNMALWQDCGDRATAMPKMRIWHTDDALFPALEVDGGLVVPPLVDVAEVVELAPLVVEAVRDLVPDDDSDAAVVERLREVLAVEVRLQDSGGENCKQICTT